jgi:uncharacterized protein YndB with AHSA1/START domain/dihydrofolate reductase
MSTNPTTISAPPNTPFIEVTRDFDATPEQLFRVSTDPDLVAQWLGPREIEIELHQYDARPGGSYRYIHRETDGTEHAFRGVFHTVVPNQRLIQTFEWEGAPGQVSLDDTSYQPIEGGVRLHMRSVFPSVEARDEMIAYGMEHGIRDTMDRLSELTTQHPEPAKSQVVVDISMSLDGYVTGPGADLDNGLGDGGEVLHTWAIDGDAADRAVLDDQFGRTGAVIQGRKLFDIIDGPHGWNDEMGYGAQPEGRLAPPIFVVTHSVPDKTRLGDRFHFITDGPESAVRQAQAVAEGKDVVVMGGGEICHQVLAAGLADLLRVHVAPVVLGEGTRLFPADSSATVALELVDSVSTPAAQHLTYRVTTRKEN